MGIEKSAVTQGKEFIYLQKNFKTVLYGNKDRSHPLWAPHISVPEREVAPFTYQVRVLLAEVTDSLPHSIGGAADVVVIPLHASKKSSKVYAGPLRVVFKGEHWYINRKKMADKQFCIKSVKGTLFVDDKQYAGSLLLIADKGKGYIVNRLDIEEYIYSVLHSENLPTWPLEMHKVLAVAARSYLMVKILEAEKKKKPFHIKNTNIHQTYNGLHDNVLLQKAVEETRGLVLMYDKKPIIAMFDACCGGVVPAHIAGTIDFEKAPYLARGYPCTFCKKFRIFSWSAQYSTLELKNVLKKMKIFVHTVHDLTVTKRDKAGLVQEVVVRDGKKTYKLTGKQWYSLCSKVKSFCFSIKKQGNNVIITGRGYGHHIGLCQWGARALVSDGWTFKKILQFYYPGTTLVHLQEK